MFGGDDWRGVDYDYTCWEGTDTMWEGHQRSVREVGGGGREEREVGG